MTIDFSSAQVIDAEFVETPGPAAPPPMPAPSPTSVRLSALILLGSLGAAYLGVKQHPEYLEVSASAVFAAVVLFLACVFRYSPAAQRH